PIKESLNLKIFVFILLINNGQFFSSNLNLEGIKEFGS
mgnify:CR=1